VAQLQRRRWRRKARAWGWALGEGAARPPSVPALGKQGQGAARPPSVPALLSQGKAAA